VLHVARFNPVEAARLVARIPRLHREFDRMPGVVVARIFVTANFWPPIVGYPTPRRYALLCAFEDGSARASFAESSAAHGFLGAASEQWRLGLEPAARPVGAWRGWHPDPAGVERLAPDEPVAVMTYGLVKPRHALRFVAATRRVAKASMCQEGLVTRFALFDQMWSMCTFSLWRSKGDALRFAYAPDGLHKTYLQPWRESWGSQSFFVRFRVIDSVGSGAGIVPVTDECTFQ